MSRTEVTRRLLRLLRPLAPLMTFSSACRVVNQGLGVAIPAVAAAMVVGIGQGAGVGPMVWLLAGMAVAKGVFRYLEQFTGHAVAFQLLSTLRVDAYRHIEPLAPAGLEAARTGDLVARVVGDVDRVEPFYAHTIAPLASAVLVPLFAAGGLAIWVDPLVAIVFLPFPLLMALIAPWVRARRVSGLSAQSRELSGEAGAVLTDAVQGAREIAVLEAEETMLERIDAASRASSGVRELLARIGAARSLLIDLIAGAAVVAVAVAAAVRFDIGAIGPAGLAAALAVGWVGTTPARALEDIVPDLEQALAAAGRLFDLADRPPAVVPHRGPSMVPNGGDVHLNGVGVRLGGVSVLENVDVDLPAFSFTAVVGPSGSGKSTLVELLLRFRDPDEGRVRIGGPDVTQMSEADLRAAVTLVPQRPELFYGTIADNLRLARPDATDEELWAVLDRAALGDWVRSLDRGLDTGVGELGEAMSGGERQRLTIARALLRDPQVLILDEATSELDEDAERRLLDVLAEERGRRTVIVVAHRLETITGADLILVLDRGRLVERGTHAELLANGGVYASLWRRHEDVLEEA